MEKPILQLEGVTFSYGDRVVLSDVSLALPLGRFVGLLGPNGAGKSTLVRLVAGLLRPRSGRVVLDGRDLHGVPRGEIARRVALLPQDAPLPPTFTGWEIALMGRAPHVGWLGTEGAVDRAVAQVALEIAGAAEYAHRRVGDLSGGERQRVLLARALAQEPDVLLLDELTVHLDPAHQLAALDLVRSLTRTADLAVLGVFHDINLAAAHCDQLAFLADRRIVAEGRPTEVLRPGLIARVYGVEASILPHPDTGGPVVVPARPRSGQEE